MSWNRSKHISNLLKRVVCLIRAQAKEQPGISPAIVNRLLDTTVFLSLKDLGLAVPHYAEEVVTLDMMDEQGRQYRSVEKKLRDLALNNRRYLSTWLQWTLARLNSAFRDEVVLSNSPMGCPTAPSAPLPVPETPQVVSWADWMSQRSFAVRTGSRGRSRQVEQDQISLF